MSGDDVDRDRSVAVIGMAGRFPDARDLEAFWHNLEAAHESLIDFDEAEMLAAGVAPEALARPEYVRRGTVLEDATSFDAGFFGINPREAEVIDPQHRVFLECAWEALEDAGYAGPWRPGSIGVFAGSSINTYLLRHVLTNPDLCAAVGPYQVMLGGDKDHLATRVAYKLDLHGPSVTVQTACSTSLVAMSLAVAALRAGHCDIALAGGVSITFPERAGYPYVEGMILSPDGRCRPFDAAARGTRAGAGAGIVVLRRLDRALRERDHVRAVIRGVGTNNDGSRKMGYTAPSVEGQSQAIAAAIADAAIDPGTLSYVEAHGTGTTLGDPIEVAALREAFRAHTDRRAFCAIGSVKGNIGHLDAAAGVAGVIKTVLALEHEAIPPTVHFEHPNPQIDFDGSPFHVCDRLLPWPAHPAAGPRRAGVSSFGIGGTNAHAILEEAPARTAPSAAWPSHLVTLSARSAAGLERAAADLGRFLASHPGVDLAEACYSLHVGRRRFPWRRTLVAATREQAIAALARPPAHAPVAREEVDRPVVFLFSGQGSQHAGMTRHLYRVHPLFREVVDECCGLLRERLGRDLRDLVYADPADGEAGRVLARTEYAQPALFTIEYALARLWMSWGIVPRAMLGHSIGEYVAACLAGVFSLPDALALVAERGRAMQSMPAGSMLAVPLAASRVALLCTGSVDLAAVNAPHLCTVTGPAESIERLRRRLEDDGIDSRPLHTSHAFHSAMMNPVLEPFAEVVRGVARHAPALPILSNLTGTWLTADEATDPGYWGRHLRQTVRFADGLREATAEGAPVMLEVGPGEVLTTFARQCGVPAGDAIASLPHPQSTTPDTDVVLGALGRLWTAGVAIDWPAFHAIDRLSRVSLPTYPFERQRFCPAPGPGIATSPAASAPAPASEPAERFHVPSWQRTAMPADVAVTGSAASGPCLVFAGNNPLSTAVLAALACSGRPAAVVRPGDGYARSAAGRYAVRPAVRDDYERLLDDLAADGLDPEAVVHLWNVTGGEAVAADRAFFDLLFLVQACAARGHRRRRDLLVVTDGLHAVGADDPVIPEKAVVLGPVKVAPVERDDLRARCVDVPVAVQDPDRIAGNLLREWSIERCGPAVAYRDGRRWEQVFVPQPLAVAGPALRPNGVFLVTGGLGGIGLAIARHLVESVRARLVLTTRSTFPPRESWNAWLASHPADDPTATRIRALAALEAAGGEVMVGTADVADEPAMAAVIEAARRRFGRIDGCIHAAGLATGGLAEIKHADAAIPVLDAKIRGTRVLERLLACDPPDVLVLCSSVDALVGRVGAVDYCAANAFLDAFAASRHALAGTHVVSVNWDAWRETGMAVREAERTGAVAELARGLATADALDAFDRVLGTSLEQVAVVSRDLPAAVERARTARVGRDAAPPLVRADAPPPGEAAVPGDASGSERLVAGIWSELLGIDDIAPDDNFFELGGHSLLGTRVLSRILQASGVSLPLRALFEAPTLRALAERLDAQRAPAGSAMTDREEIEL